MTRARWSCSLTRTIATRSHSPATEYTSEMPSMSAMACPASAISSISHAISTTALTIPVPFGLRSLPFQDHGHALAARDAQGREPEDVRLVAHLVGEREHDAC